MFQKDELAFRGTVGQDAKDLEERARTIRHGAEVARSRPPPTSTIVKVEPDEEEQGAVGGVNVVEITPQHPNPVDPETALRAQLQGLEENAPLFPGRRGPSRPTQPPHRWPDM